MVIRELSEKDMKDALELVWTVFSEFEALEYEPEGIAVFREFIAFDSISEMLSAGISHLILFRKCFRPERCTCGEASMGLCLQA